MKIWRYIWIILLLIVLFLGVPLAFMNWNEIHPGLLAFYQEKILGQKSVEEAKPGAEQKEEKDTAEKAEKKASGKDEAEKKIAKTAAIEEMRSKLVFQVTNIKSNGGEITGFAPAGWLVRVSHTGGLVSETGSNDKDGRWVVVVDRKNLSPGKYLFKLEASSPDKKLTVASGQTLEVTVFEGQASVARVVRFEKDKEPFEMQKGQATVNTASATDAPRVGKLKTFKAPAEEQKKAAVPAADLLALGSFELNRKSADSGDLLVKGKAEPGKSLKIYVDDKEIGASKADDTGLWIFAETLATTKNEHNVRVEQVDDRGAVVASREKSFKSAAYVEPPKAEEVKKEDIKPVEKKEEKAEAPQKAEAASRTRSADLTGTLAKDTAGASEARKTDPASSLYVVVLGDTLWGIAVRKYGDGMFYWKIYKTNQQVIRSPDLIYPGQRFKLP